MSELIEHTPKNVPQHEVLSTGRTSDMAVVEDAVYRSSTWPYFVFGGLVLAVMLGGLVYWATHARLDGAVIASAEFTVASKRKTIQHLEGGIVEKILVGEGERVSKDQLLVRLDGTSVKANFAVIESELQQLTAQRTRLRTELRGERSLVFEPVSTSLSPEMMSRLPQIQLGQRQLFRARLASRDNEMSIRKKRVLKLRREIDGIERQKRSNGRQIAIIEDELVSLRRLRQRELVPKRRLLALEREAERIRGTSEALDVNVIRARNSIDEIELEELQARRQFREQIATELQTIEPRITRLVEQHVSARKQLSLLEIRAPSSGHVVDMKVSTVGGVIRAGDGILDIVPENEKLILEARVSTVDVDKIQSGHSARIQLSAFDQSTTPEALGKVLSISADRLQDERSGDNYFLARLELDASQPKAVDGLTIVPGMPATVFIQTGSRTPFSYFLQPFSDRLKRVFTDG